MLRPASNIIPTALLVAAFLAASLPVPLRAQPAPPPGAPTPAPDAGEGASTDEPYVVFRLAENTFRYQDYERAVQLLEGLLYPAVLLAEEDELRAREYLGASYWWQKSFERAEEEFTSVLTRRPEHTLDAFYYPAALIAFFDGVRQKLVRLKVIRPPEAPPEPETLTDGPRILRERTIEKRSMALAFVPFGVGQFHNGDTGKGVAFLTVETLALATNIASYFLIESLREKSGFIAPQNIDRAESLEIVLYVSLGVFVATTVGGIVDAAVSFEPQRETVRDIPLDEDGEEPETALRVVPSLAPDSFGLDLQLRF